MKRKLVPRKQSFCHSVMQKTDFEAMRQRAVLNGSIEAKIELS